MAKIVNYIKESYDELVNKVSWPTWAELQNSAVVVSIASFVIALVVFLMDIVLGINPQMQWSGLLGYFYEAFG